MGGAVSAGEDNDELIDNLVEADYIKTPQVEKVFRAVDRGNYYLPGFRDNAYKDLAWKHGNLHMSAPCIYSEVLESLQLEPGLSFLNLGSGTGYLNTMAGLIIGPHGVNHGIEIHPDVVEHSKACLENFRHKSDAFDEFEFCDPEFVVGNCLLINSGCRLYDRVYCGAACPPEHENYMKNLIKVGGVLVMPLNDQLVKVTRESETKWDTVNMLPVQFATLISPMQDASTEMVELPDVRAVTLQHVCRISIRRILRRNINAEHPEFNKKKLHRVKRAKKLNKPRLNIVPMNMGMMLMANYDGDSDYNEGIEEDMERNPADIAEADEHSTSEEEVEVEAQSSDTEKSSMVTEEQLCARETLDSETVFVDDVEESIGKPIRGHKKDTQEADRNDSGISVSSSLGNDPFEEMDMDLNSDNAILDEDDAGEIGQEERHRRFSPVHEERSVSDDSDIEDDEDHPSFLEVMMDLRNKIAMRKLERRKAACEERKRALGIDESVEECENNSGQTNEDNNESSNLEPFTAYMDEKVNSLPIPTALKAYVMYYRS